MTVLAVLLAACIAHAAPQAAVDAGPAELVALQTRDGLVRVYADATYTVEGPDGVAIATHVDADALARIAPDAAAVVQGPVWAGNELESDRSPVPDLR
jgi:hypothetical protein